SALAGAAKTSTLVMVAHALEDTSILCLAFNKKIADEMKGRLPSNCMAMTLNSIGHRTWSASIGRRSKPSTKKTFNIMTKLLEKERKDLADQVRENFSGLMEIIREAKSSGFIPESAPKKPALRLFPDD